MTTLPDAHTALLLALDPVVVAFTENEIPVGDPLGNHWVTRTMRLSEVVRDHGWEHAFGLDETQRLLRNIGGES